MRMRKYPISPTEKRRNATCISQLTSLRQDGARTSCSCSSGRFALLYGTRTIVLTPRIPHNPVLLARFLVRSPSHDRYNVVDHHIPNVGVVDHPTGIIQNRIGVDTCGDRSTRENFGFNLAGDRTESTRIITVRSVLGNRSVGKAVNGLTAARRVAGSAGVDGTAAGVDVGTKAVRAVRAARDVRLTGVVGNKTGFALDKLVDSRRRAAE